MEDLVVDFQKQHLENYKNAVLEILKNNSIILVDEDIASLLKKPPLDSMDVIKCKFLDLAKRKKIILDTKKLDKMLSEYRKEVISEIDEIKEARISKFSSIIDNFVPVKESDIIKFNKKEFNDFNKIMKKNMKKSISNSLEKNIVNNVNMVFTKETEEETKKKISIDICKFLTKTYISQLLDSIDFKILVKDTTLINGVKEQGERYIFTKMNSHLLNDKIKTSKV